MQGTNNQATDPTVRLAIIIVNYRTPALVVDCLASLGAELAAVGGETRVVVVDNCSGDQSAEKIKAAIEGCGWGRWADVLPLGENKGFAGGNNAGIAHVVSVAGRPEFVLLLNPDTVVRPGGVTSLLRFMEANPKAGIVGGQLEDADGRRESSARRVPSPWSELDSAARLGPVTRLVGRHVVAMPIAAEPHACDWVSGACMLIRGRVIEDIGLLDEGFFLYFEEVDFCTRARKAGWECWYVPGSHVLHLEGSSTGIRQARKRRAPYWYESRRRFFTKHYGRRGLVAADLLWSLGRVAALAGRPLRKGRPNNDPLRFARDLLGGDLKALVTRKP